MESACFDPNTIQEGGGLVEDGFSHTHVPNCSPRFSMEDHSYHPQNPSQHAAAAMEMELQQQLNLEMEQGHDCINTNTTNLQEMVHHESIRNQMLSSCDPSNWEDMSFVYHQQEVEMQNIQHQIFTMPLPDTQKPSSNFLTSLGLLGDLSLPEGGASMASSSVVYDPLLPVNLPPQPPLLRELIPSLPHGYDLGSSRNGSLFTGIDDREESDGLFQDGGDGSRSYENGIFDFTADVKCIGKKREGKGTKHFATERQRRVQWNEKYQALKNLVPNPTKNDRASIVGDAIEYINELKRTVTELKILVERKRCSRERLKSKKVEDEAEGAAVKTELDDLDQPYNGSSLRSSWLHRKSKNTEVDVRIVDDEVTVKLVQQKKINCLLFVSKVLDELQLDLHHVAGGLIGDYFSFLFNSKICEGSTVHAHAIANKLIDVMDKEYAAVQPTSSY